MAQVAIEDSVKTVDLIKAYKVGTIDYQALVGINLTFKRGEFSAIVGPSGSGKTTLLNMLGTLDKPTSGDIYIDGIALSKLHGNELAEFRNRKLGFVFQSFNLVPGLSAEKNVELPLLAAGVSPEERRKKARTNLERLGLGDKVYKKPTELSGGEQQRVAIARALINDPSLVLADEPTGNLDSKSAEGVVSVLKRASEERNVTTLIVTHNMELTKHCKRIVYLRDGYVEREDMKSS